MPPPSSIIMEPPPTGSLNEGGMVNSDTFSITVYFDVSVGMEWGGDKRCQGKRET